MRGLLTCAPFYLTSRLPGKNTFLDRRRSRSHHRKAGKSKKRKPNAQQRFLAKRFVMKKIWGMNLAVRKTSKQGRPDTQTFLGRSPGLLCHYAPYWVAFPKVAEDHQRPGLFVFGDRVLHHVALGTREDQSLPGEVYQFFGQIDDPCPVLEQLGTRISFSETECWVLSTLPFSDILARSQAKPIGIMELYDIRAVEQQAPTFPFDFPDLPAGRAWWTQDYQERMDLEAKKPPAKRLATPKFRPDMSQDCHTQRVKGNLPKGVPQRGALLLDAADKSVIGFVTNGGFSLKTGGGAFIGQLKASYQQETCWLQNDRSPTSWECQIQRLGSKD